MVEQKEQSVLGVDKERFLDYMSNGQVASEQTIRAYRSDLDHFEEFLESEGVADVKGVDPETLHNYFSQLQDGGYKNSTLIRKLASIRSFFDMLVDNHERIERNPTRKMDYPKMTERLPEYLTEEEMEALLEAPDTSTLTGKRNQAILETIYSTGMRASELHQLNIQDVDQVGRTVRVKGKGNKERVVPIGKKAIDVIQDYLRAWKQEGRILSGTSGPLICNKFGKRLSLRGIRRAVSSEKEKAGVSKDVSPHTLRHTFATHMLENGADLRTLQEMLGHENLHTTEIYTHIADGKLKETYDQSNPVS